MKITSTDPSNNYAVLGQAEAASEADVVEAIQKARAAQSAWANLSLSERCKKIESFMNVCKDRAEEIAQIMTAEMGKPITAARGQVAEALEYFADYIKQAEEVLKPTVVFENATEKHIQHYEPKGVIVAITPWNFPFLNVPFQAGQALIAGNTVVYKPSEEVVLFTRLLSELIEQSDLPKGVFIPIIGDGKVGEVLVSQPVDTILFTGSTKTGQRITELAAAHSTPVLTEMGGSAPGIVFEDADIEKVIDMLADMRFGNTGQYCDGLKRLIVHTSKYEAVLDGLKKYAAKTKVGNPLEEDTKIGPLVSKRQLDTLVTQVKDATDKGATILVGGKQPNGLQGAYYEITVLTNITFDMRVWKEEVFGPVLPVVTFDTEEEAVTLANDTIYGLGGYIFTEDVKRFRRVAAQLKTGNVGHNTALYFSPATPFGGYKKSGNGRSQGTAGFHEVTQIKVTSEEK